MNGLLGTTDTKQGTYVSIPARIQIPEQHK